MTFSAFCEQQTTRIDSDLCARYQAYLRRQFVWDAALERRRRLLVIAEMFSPSLARDIAEWRVEA